MSQNTEIPPLLPAAPIPQPASWLGFKLINQAAANELGAAVLPSANSLAGNVLCALTDADGDALYVAGIVVAVTFTASAVRYSVAFPVAPQPRAGMTMYAVVDNIESGNLLADLPEGETVFDSVLTEDAAALIPPVKLVLDGVNPLQPTSLEGQLIERRAALAELAESDPVATLAVARDVIDLARQVLAAVPVADPLASARFRLTNDSRFTSLTNDFIQSLSVIKGVDEGTAQGWDRSLFVNSIAGKIKTQAKHDPELAGMLLAWLDAAQRDWKKFAITARNGVWATVEDWSKYKPLFGAVTPPPAPVPVEVEPIGPSEQFESYRARIEELLAEGGMIPAGMLEQIQRDERLNDGEAGQLEALATPTPTITSKASMETLIKIAADTVAQLRRIDVYRVLDAAGDQRAELATFIATNRPDLVREVTDVMAEEWPVLSWTLAAAAEGSNAELEEAGFKNVSGNEWAKGVQGENGKLNLNIRVFATPEQFKLKKSATFTGGISGSPSQEVGTYNTAAEAIAAAQAEATAFAPTAELSSLAGGATAQGQNPARAADLAFLSSVISKSVDMWDDALADKIEAMGAAYEGDAEVESLWGDAIKAYTDFMVEAMG